MWLTKFLCVVGFWFFPSLPSLAFKAPTYQSAMKEFGTPPDRFALQAHSNFPHAIPTPHIDPTNSFQFDEPRRISILGSTGSIGKQTLNVIERCPQNFRVVGLTGGSNFELLAKQIKQFRPKIAALQDTSKFEKLIEKLKEMGIEHTHILRGNEGVNEVAKFEGADVVVTGIVGCAGLLPTVCAIKSGKQIALANKETLVSAGPVILQLLKEYHTHIVPADSEHSAIFQCVQGNSKNSLKRLILTASGGAFLTWPVELLSNVQIQDALKHPNWSMGAKITIDSATMMNKGLEVIEAHFLFGVGYENIEIVVHPKSIVHSIVEFSDSSMVAQLGRPDMRIPLLYSLSWPHRVDAQLEPLDLTRLGPLEFQPPDLDKYPSISLAYDAGQWGGTAPAALNAANEVAVDFFRRGRIEYNQMPKVWEKVLDAHTHKSDNLTLEDILSTDLDSRRLARNYIKEHF